MQCIQKNPLKYAYFCRYQPSKVKSNLASFFNNIKNSWKLVNFWLKQSIKLFIKTELLETLTTAMPFKASYFPEILLLFNRWTNHHLKRKIYSNWSFRLMFLKMITSIIGQKCSSTTLINLITLKERNLRLQNDYDLTEVFWCKILFKILTYSKQFILGNKRTRKVTITDLLWTKNVNYVSKRQLINLFFFFLTFWTIYNCCLSTTCKKGEVIKEREISKIWINW